MDKPRVISPIKCFNCSEVTVFEIYAPAPGKSLSFEFVCGHCGKPATNPQGGTEVVNLKDYDESKLKHVVIR